jgi:hypothetical protein
MYWRPREEKDVNDMNFVTDPTDPERTVQHSDFVQNAWSNNEWLGDADDDNCGFYTTFLVRPGVRKLNQQKIQVTITQTQNEYKPALFSVAFFGSRLGTYDDATDTFTPSESYFSMNNVNTMMMCDTLKGEMKNTSGITAELQAKKVIPPPIALTAGGFYRQYLLQDVALMSPFDFKGAIRSGSEIFTNHEISMPMFPTFSDNFAVPDGAAIQWKIMIYFLRTDYSRVIPPNDVNATTFNLIPNDNILAISSPMQFL